MKRRSIIEVAHPLHEHERGLESSLGTTEGKAETKVGNLLLQQNSQPLFDLRELLLFLVGDGAHTSGSEKVPHLG